MDIIQNVAMKMSDSLSKEQLDKLVNVMTTCVHDYTITPNTEIACTETEWKKVLNFYLASKKLKNCSDGTIENYGLCISNLMTALNKNVQDVTTNDLRYYITQYRMKRNVSQSYLNTLRRYMNSFFSFCQKEGFIDHNPAERLEKIKVPKTIKKPFTYEEMEILKESAGNLRDIALMYVLYSTAGRIGEIVALNKNDIDFTSGQVILYGQKGKAERIVYITPVALYHLKKYLKSRNDDNEALFVALRAPHKRVTKNGVEYMFRKLSKKTGIKAHPHKFRRTLLTNGSRRGMPVQELQKYAGHVKIDTTMMYISIDNEDVKSSFSRHIG